MGPGLYVHLPWCVRKCRYCDFHSHAWRDQDLTRTVDALLCEAERRAGGMRPKTVFVGGGTPTLLPAPELRRLLDGLDAVTSFRASAVEVTCEANPESFDDVRAEALRAGGVDRISLGVQSLDDATLARWDRVHDADAARAAFRRAREHGFVRVNVDLIFGWPGHDAEAWRTELEEVLGWEPEHVSCYELMVEPDTALGRAARRGRFAPADDRHRRRLFDLTREVCAAHGFGGYEVSAFARAGEACAHNLNYWRSGEWVGLGVGATSRSELELRTNLTDPAAWTEAALATGDPVGEVERPDPRTRLFDRFLMGLRLPEEGVDLARARDATGLDPERVFGDAWRTLLDDGRLERAAPDRIRVGEEGLRHLDTVLLELLPDETRVHEV